MRHLRDVVGSSSWIRTGWRRLAIGGVVALGLLAHSAGVRANGRYPEANQLAVDVGDAQHIVVRTTFGLVQSFDGGSTWSWICEEAVTRSGFLDPEVMIGSGGGLVLGLSDGIAASDRPGCRWSRGLGDVVGHQVIDLVAEPEQRTTAYAALVVTMSGAFTGRIAKTNDGVNWSFIGNLLTNTYPLTIEVARSRPERLYLGVNDANLEFGFIDVSDDAGVSWTRHASPGGVDAVYVSAVDPENADRVYVRSYFPGGALYVSEDGGVTYTSIHSSVNPLLGFALSPDGRQVAVGSEDGIVVLTRSDAGNGTSSYAITRMNELAVTCLTWTTAGLFACTSELENPFSVSVSIDDGVTFTPLLSFANLVPVSCPADSLGAQCRSLWCPLALRIEASCILPPEELPDAGTDAGNSTDAGGAGRTSNLPDAGLADPGGAGRTGNLPDAGLADAGMSGVSKPAQSSSGCGCGMAKPWPAGSWASVMGMAMLLSVRRHRRHKAVSSSNARPGPLTKTHGREAVR